MHDSTFEYLKPTDEQVAAMQDARDAARIYANQLDRVLPDGPDKTYTLRKLREVGMWPTLRSRGRQTDRRERRRPQSFRHFTTKETEMADHHGGPSPEKDDKVGGLLQPCRPVQV